MSFAYRLDRASLQPVRSCARPQPQRSTATWRVSAASPAQAAQSLGVERQQRAAGRLAAAPVRAPQYVDPWSKIVDAEKSGATLEVTVQSVNKGGLVVMYGDLRGFIPYNQLARADQASDWSSMVGQKVKGRVVSVDSSNGRKDFVLSEKKAQMAEAMRYVKLGGLVKAVVRSIEDYGAFVELVEVPGVTGLLHKSELSWDSVLTVDSVVQKGQVLQVKVIDLDPVKGRLALSLKQTQPDPIHVTLDTLQWGPTREMPDEIEQLMNRLRVQPEVASVTIGRQASGAKIASQELGVYLTKEVSENGFDVVARLGTVVQELHVEAKITRDEARALLARVAG